MPHESRQQQHGPHPTSASDTYLQVQQALQQVQLLQQQIAGGLGGEGSHTFASSPALHHQRSGFGRDGPHFHPDGHRRNETADAGK